MKHLLLLLLMLNSMFLVAQVANKSEDDAKRMLKQKPPNFDGALKVYQQLIKKEPKNVDYNLKLAICYLNSRTIRTKARPYLEFLLKQPKFESIVYLFMGQVEQYEHKYDDAIKNYKKYLEKEPKENEIVQRYISECETSKLLVKNPIRTNFVNMGKDINSEFADYIPLVTNDDQTLIYTTRRKGQNATQQEMDGLYPSDILIATRKPDGKFGKGTSIGTTINTVTDEQATGLSYDGSILVFRIDHIDIFGDLWTSTRPNGRGLFNKIEPLGDNVNAGNESAGMLCKTTDGENSMLVFSSNRSGSLGIGDLYMTRLLPTGEWGTPQNMGANINTKLDEDYPMLSPDGRTLYFASQGLQGMGGYDLFKADWDDKNQTFGPPVNLGYPINDAYDNKSISFSEDGKFAYVSAIREEGLGDYDIYRVAMPGANTEVVIKGFVYGGETGTEVIKNAHIQVEDKKTHELHGTFSTTKRTGSYVMVLPKGLWKINIEVGGKIIYTEEYVVPEPASSKSEVLKDFRIKKQ